MIEVIFESLGIAWFLLVGICGCLYPFMMEKDKTDGDNT